MRLIVVAAVALFASSQHHHTAPAVSAVAERQILEVQKAAQAFSTPERAKAAGFEPSLGWIPMMGTHYVHGQRMLEGRRVNVVLTKSVQDIRHFI